MDEIKIYKNIELVNPVMVAGWPGMGSVALGVVDYLRKTLKAVKFAQIKIDPMTALDAVMVENGLAALPPAPQNIFYYTKDPDLIIFEGEAQIHGRDGIALLDKVLDVASRFKVKMIYTGAAFPLPVSYKEPPEVYGAVSERSLIDFIVKAGINTMESGQISGLNGLMLGFAKEKNIKAACLLATMPQYAISLPNPKASRAIIEVMVKMVNFKIDLSGLDGYIKDMEDKMAVIEDNVKDVLIIDRQAQKAPKPHKDEKKPPAYIIEKLERLFREAKQDRSKAINLKKELDRWDLYKLYEDRFLDLFKDSQ